MITKDQNGKCSIPNRRGLDYYPIKNLPEINRVADALPLGTVIDGELVAFNSESKIDRLLTQRRCGTKIRSKAILLAKRIPIHFFAFDILKLRGKDLTRKPFVKRKALLEKLVAEISGKMEKITDAITLRYLPYQTEGFVEMFEQESEGVVIKRLNSSYVGSRSIYWLKCKHTLRQVCNVIGYTEGKGRNTHLWGALVLTKNGRYVGKCGGGFSDVERAKIKLVLDKSQRLRPDWKLMQAVKDPFTMVKTELKIETIYSEETVYHIMFQPRKLNIIWPQEKTLLA